AVGGGPGALRIPRECPGRCGGGVGRPDSVASSALGIGSAARSRARAFGSALDRSARQSPRRAPAVLCVPSARALVHPCLIASSGIVVVRLCGAESRDCSSLLIEWDACSAFWALRLTGMIMHRPAVVVDL